MQPYLLPAYNTWHAVHYTPVVPEENNEAVELYLHRHPYTKVQI